MRHRIKLLGEYLEIEVTGYDGQIVTHMGREKCPSCLQPNCFGCEGSQGDNAKESKADVADRLRINGFLEALEHLALVHACEGINIMTEPYQNGLKAVLQLLVWKGEPQ